MVSHSYLEGDDWKHLQWAGWENDLHLKETEYRTNYYLHDLTYYNVNHFAIVPTPVASVLSVSSLEKNPMTIFFLGLSQSLAAIFSLGR